MQLTEQHGIKHTDPRFAAIDHAAFAAKNIYSDWKRNNQTFVSIPHARFIHMLTYKAELRGIHVIITEESHTSTCSFLDGELVCHHDHYVGNRVRRGLFRAADGQHINANVNGAYNSIRKVAPDTFSQGSRGCVVHPLRLAAETVP